MQQIEFLTLVFWYAVAASAVLICVWGRLMRWKHWARAFERSFIAERDRRRHLEGVIEKLYREGKGNAENGA